MSEIDAAERSKLTTRAAMASIAMAVVLIALKSWAAYETDSTAMLGSLADSGLDLLASLVVLLGVRIAAQPADWTIASATARRKRSPRWSRSS